MTQQPGTDVAQYGNNGAVVGLEGVDASDVILPRLSIVHAEGQFEENLAKVRFSELDCILLGLVKQRVFWHSQTDDGDKPLCKSPDHTTGFPNLSEDIPAKKRFPWDRSNFDPADFPPGPNGQVALPCASCIFKEWDQGDWDAPPCAEQHTYPLLYNATPEEDFPTWQPAILTFQKTGIKPSRAYLSGFVQQRKPLFTARTRIKLNVLKRGTVDYSVPEFSKSGATDDSMWPEYGEQYLQIAAFLRQPPRTDEEEVPATADNTNTPAPTAPAASSPTAAPAPAQAAQATPPPATAPPQPVAASAEVPEPTPADDDLPF